MFLKAVPIFAENKEKEKNYHLILRAVTKSLKDTVMYISAYSFYRLTVNGHFVSFGPARAAEGYARVDTISLDEYDREGGENEIIIEVSGYYCRSLSTVMQDSFVVAELRQGDSVLLHTGRDFCGYRATNRLQKTERYSVQRHFGEIWDLRGNDLYDEADRVRLTEVKNAVVYLPRRAPMANTRMVYADGYVSAGSFSFDESLPCSNNRYSFEADERWGRYAEDEISYFPYRWLQKQRTFKTKDTGKLPLRIDEGEYVILDMKTVECGFLCWEAEVLEDSDVVLGFSEMCPSDRFEFTNVNSQNVIEYLLKCGGSVKTMSFEPYTCRFAVIMVKKGGIVLSSFGVRRFAFDPSKIIGRRINDPELAKIYEAAVTTFAHNAVDIYMDCPSRERAGWLCDSFFTGRAEYFLTGKSAVEDAFLENYRLYKNNGEYPRGVLPMCYPSDPQYKADNFIPQWNMWYIIEVKEYITTRNTAVDKELFRESVYGVLRFLEGYEDGDGLLQNIPGWNFVEWSTANQWVRDVNYPTNFLYAEVLRSVGELYGEPALIEKGNRIASIAREKSFDGEVFIDNAVFDSDGALRNTRNSSEAGQYYALLFGDVDIELPEYAKLKAHIMSGFKDFDATDRGFVPVNAFIGFYLRILTLMKLGKKELLSKDIKEFFGGMVEATGTLWELKQHKGSYDHGFASFAAVAIDFIENTH